MTDATHTPEPERVTIDREYAAHLLRIYELGQGSLFAEGEIAQGGEFYDSLVEALDNPQNVEWAQDLRTALAAHPSPPAPALPTRSQLMDVFLSVNLLSRPLLITAMIEAGLAVDDDALTHPSPPTNALCGVDRDRAWLDENADSWTIKYGSDDYFGYEVSGHGIRSYGSAESEEDGFRKARKTMEQQIEWRNALAQTGEGSE